MCCSFYSPSLGHGHWRHGVCAQSRETDCCILEEYVLIASCSGFNRILIVLTSFITSFAVGYVPDGMTPAQWKKYQEAERKQKAQKNFGALGPQSFKSRSLQSFQTDLEKGKASHLLPVMFAKDRVKKGEIKKEDIPYMQRGGNWDDSDVKGAKKKQWNPIDKKYEAMKGPSKKVDWTGRQARTGPEGKTTEKKKPATKKLFGMF